MCEWPFSEPSSKCYKRPWWQCFFCVYSWSYTNSERKKLKKAINFTGSGLFLTQLGLCILPSVGARVELIKDTDIWATLYELDDFLSNQKSAYQSMSAYWNLKPTLMHKPVPMSETKVSKSSLMKKKGKKHYMMIPGLFPLILDPWKVEREQLI